MFIQLLISLIWALAPSVAPAQTADEIAKITASAPKGTSFSITILDAGNKKKLFALNPSAALKPASNIKLATACASLLYLKPAYQIKTSLYYDPKKVSAGILKENLYIKGFGNPSLNDGEINNLALQLTKEGIKSIEGNIVYDNSFFPVVRSRLGFNQLPLPTDLPAISPLSVNNNIITVTYNGGKFNALPSSSFIRIETGINSRMEEGNGGIKIFIDKGKLNNGKGAIYFYLKEPARFAALLLKEKLFSAGITVKGNINTGITPNGLKELYVITQLSEIIKEINTNSNNYYAETLFEMMKKIMPGSNNGTDKHSAITGFLSSEGIDCGGMVIADGSGISPKNRISSASLADILLKMGGEGESSKSFRNSLAVAGRSGTLKELYSNSTVADKFKGKSGFMAGTSSLSGYLETKGGKKLIIAVIINFKNGDINFYRELERKILETLYLKN